MKIVNKQKVFKSPVLAKLMQQELEILQKTNHPHIVKFHELLEDDVNFYLVSELIKGIELYEHIMKAKYLSERQTASITRQLLLALNYMHQRNIVHRDMKPENILISQTPDGEGDNINVKLTDFGFACTYDKEFGMQTVLGTPYYMAPEIVKKFQYGCEVDVWSVGVICHILLTGTPPFDGENKEEIHRKIVGRSPSFGNAEIKHALSSRAISFINECLIKTPKDRPSAEELLQNPWLQDNTTSPEVDHKSTMLIGENLKNFRKLNNFQTGIVAFLANMK